MRHVPKPSTRASRPIALVAVALAAILAMAPRSAAAQPAQASVPPSPPSPPPMVDVGAAAKAAYPELLDLRARWVYEVVEGASIASLKRVAATPRVFGVVDLPTIEDGLTVVKLWTRPEGGKIARDLGATTNRTVRVAFDQDGIRQLAELYGSPIGASLRGFTFPTKLDGARPIVHKAPFGTVKIDVTRQKLTIAKQRRDVLIADTTITEDRHHATTFERFAYAPQLGPALLCSVTEDRKDWLCLRLVGKEERRCAVVADRLCTGSDGPACDAVLRKLLVDPDRGTPRTSIDAEKVCDRYLTHPAELQAVVDAMKSPR